MSEINFNPLDAGLRGLEQGLAESELRPNDELCRDGVVYRFGYCMDSSCKILQRYFKVIAQIDEATIRTKKDIFREAARLKLITDPEAWIGHYEARNETSHIYNAEIAKQVFERSRMFLPDAKALLATLRYVLTIQ